MLLQQCLGEILQFKANKPSSSATAAPSLKPLLAPSGSNTNSGNMSMLKRIIMLIGAILDESSSDMKLYGK